MLFPPEINCLSKSKTTALNPVDSIDYNRHSLPLGIKPFHRNGSDQARGGKIETVICTKTMMASPPPVFATWVKPVGAEMACNPHEASTILPTTYTKLANPTLIHTKQKESLAQTSEYRCRGHCKFSKVQNLLSLHLMPAALRRERERLRPIKPNSRQKKK